MRIGNTDVAALELESFRDKWPATGIDEPAVEAPTAAARLPPLTPARRASVANYRELLQHNVDGLRNLLASVDRGSPRGIGLDGLEVAGLIAIARANYNLMFLNYGCWLTSVAGASGPRSVEQHPVERGTPDVVVVRTEIGPAGGFPQAPSRACPLFSVM